MKHLYWITFIYINLFRMIPDNRNKAIFSIQGFKQKYICQFHFDVDDEIFGMFLYKEKYPSRWIFDYFIDNGYKRSYGVLVWWISKKIVNYYHRNYSSYGDNWEEMVINYKRSKRLKKILG